MKATIGIERITPAQAAEYLNSLHEKQRPQREQYIEGLAAEILKGLWRLSCDAIVLVKGLLANGQHRMAAVVMANKTCEFLVMRTDDEQLFDIIDCGIKRNVSDVLCALKNASKICATGRIVCCYKNKTMATVWIGKEARSTQLDYIRDNEEILNSNAIFCANLYFKYKIIPSSWGAALMTIAGKHERKKVEQYITQLYSGGKEDNAAIVMREMLIRDSKSKRKMRKPYILALLIKSFNAFVSGDIEASYFKMSEGEKFPRILGEAK